MIRAQNSPVPARRSGAGESVSGVLPRCRSARAKTTEASFVAVGPAKPRRHCGLSVALPRLFGPTWPGLRPRSFSQTSEGYLMSDGNSHFLMAVGRIDGGLAIETADSQLRDVIAAVQRTGKKGTVAITLEVSPNGEMGFAATCKVVAKAPQINFGQSFFYMGRDGDLTRQAPDLHQLGLMKGEKADG